MNTRDYAKTSFDEEEPNVSAVKRKISSAHSRKRLWVITVSFGVLGLVGILWLQSIKKHKVSPQSSLTTEESVKAAPQYEFYQTLESGEIKMLEDESRLSANDDLKKENASDVHSEVISAKPVNNDNKIVNKVHHSNNKSKSLEAKNNIKHNKSASSSTSSKNAKYYSLQLGSFRKYKEADEFKARLALKGNEVIIETVVLVDGQKWYRVKSKPIDSYQMALKERARLSKVHVNSMITQVSAVG